ncbi:MAG: hypothetical protein RBJ76_14050 [Stenomitos frigidus ULC029]
MTLFALDERVKLARQLVSELTAQPYAIVQSLESRMLETDSSPSLMDATLQQQQLQQLAQQLQMLLRPLPHASLVQIQCVVRQGHLMILGQHPPEETPDPQAIFSALEQAIPALLPEFEESLGHSAEATPQAKLYLRTLGQRQPYAAHTFRLPSIAAPVEPLLETTDAEGFLDGNKPTINEAALEGGLDDSTAVNEATDPEPENAELAHFDPDLAPIARPARSSLFPWLVAGMGVSIIGFAGGLWFMSRPCMVGACEPLQAAQTLKQQSLQALQTAKTSQDLQQAQQQLTKTQQLLQDIPQWSRSHNEAQALQQAAQAQVQTLDLALGAENKANTATQKSQALPQSVADLRATQGLWREAIAQLQTISQADPLYTFAQGRLATYAANLAVIGKLSVVEQQAQKKLVTAKETASIATARQGIAQTPESWQLAQVTWQVAINTLRQISSTTTSHTEAQRLLADYQPKLATARDRATQEQIAKRAFNQAIALAQNAEAAQRRNQWSQAVRNWQDALTNMKQVPTNTAYAEPAQPLVESYSTALRQAEAQLQVAAARQRTRDDLNRLCAGSPRMCTYAIGSTAIRVQFTSAYERKLRTAFILGQSGDPSTLGGAVNHVETLQTALQTISSNAGLPLEVFSAEGGELIGSFNPQG